MIGFIPVGLLTGQLWRWKGTIYSLVLSIVVEAVQLITARGLFEFDDVIHNVVGTVVGIAIVLGIEKIKK